MKLRKPNSPKAAGPHAVHAHAHIAICPDEQMHVRVGNVCLHLCRRDFCQLAKAVVEAMATLETDERTSILGEIH